MDSGASETVIIEDMLPNIPIKQGGASRRGVQYEVANGVRIPNIGEKNFQGYSEEGTVRSIATQVCELNEGLLSVRKVVRAGIVRFRQHGVVHRGQENARAHVHEGRGRDVHVVDVRHV